MDQNMSEDAESRGDASPNRLITSFLSPRSETFHELRRLKVESWKEPEADRHFEKQQRNADQPNYKTKQVFFSLMQRIGDEMQEKTGAIRLPNPFPGVLDLCMAPGGYTATALKYNPDACVRGISLPLNMGGHRMLVPYGSKDGRVDVRYLDVTMLSSEFGVNEVPQDHPERSKFLVDQHPYSERSFDLVFCDGQVLRTQAPHRAEYREQNEATRLSCSQLILALNRIKSGGTMIMLLHKVEARSSITLLNLFDKIAEIVLFKPVKTHAIRSSFYLVAKNVRTEHPEAQSAIEAWKDTWRAATFPGTFDVAQSASEVLTDPALEVEKTSLLLSDFGERLVELAEPIWEIQLKALKKAPWLTKRGKDEPQAM